MDSVLTVVNDDLRANRHSKRLAAVKQGIAHLCILILLFFVVVPIYFLIVKSLKSPEQETMHPFSVSFPLIWENYSLAWLFVKDYILNTVVIALCQTFGVLLVCSCASYAFVRYKFPFKNVLFIIILSFMMVPGILTLIPQYQMVLNVFNLKNSYFGVILPAIAGAVPMGIFLLNTFFSGLPKDLFEAAQIDGASLFRCYYAIALPLSMPILGTITIMQIVNVWNDYIWPQLVLSEEKFTVSAGLLLTFKSEYTSNMPVMFAGYLVASSPLILLFIFANKFYIQGLVGAAIKM